jgi:putative RecB family exonuclease
MATYSHSKLSTFEQCPLKFKFRYIDYLEPDIKQTIEGFLGNRVHDTLEWIYREAMDGRSLQLDEIIEFYLNSWKKELSDDVKVVNESLNSEYYLNQGLKLLIDYFSTFYPFKDDTIETEKLIIVNLDNCGKYRVQGYIDRLVHHKDTNIFEIHDYKTGSLKSQEELNKDRQLALYSIAIKEQFNPKQIDLVWHFLAFNKKMTSFRNEEELSVLKKEIISLIDKIESTISFSPNPGCLCKWCEFRSHCPTIRSNKEINNEKDCRLYDYS